MKKIKNILDFVISYEREFVAAKHSLKMEDFPGITQELFLQFEKNGNRLEYENVYFKRRKYLSVYAMLAMLYKKEDDIECLIRILDEVCEEECWALPAHVDTKKADWRITIDLFAAETAFSLADIVVRLEAQLPRVVCEKIKTEVFRRVLVPFMEGDRPYAWWETSKMNWCAVCCGSIGAAAILLMEDRPKELESLIDRIKMSIMNYVDGFSDDGACLEGLSYYTYGMSFFSAFAELAYEYSGGKINLLSGEKVKNIALFGQKCFLPGGVSVSFSDGSCDDRYRLGLMLYLSQYFEDIEFPDISMAAGLEADNCYRYVVLSRDILWARRFCEKEGLHIVPDGSFSDNCDSRDNSNEELQIVLPFAQWSICRSTNKCAVAVKGGHNDEPHNHNDVGSFMYTCDGDMILADIGAGEYTKDYFNEHRYENICCSSLGHNVPIIGGRLQRSGKECKASCFEADGYGKTVIGMAPAYGLCDNEDVKRTIEFNAGNGACIITDEFVLNEENVIMENLVSHYEPDCKENGFVIKLGNAKVDILIENGADYVIKEEKYVDHLGNKKCVWLMQWTVEGDTSCFVIRPVN